MQRSSADGAASPRSAKHFSITSSSTPITAVSANARCKGACSFQRLLDDTRRELAQQYLGQTGVSLADATYLQGFGDKSSFFRASKRWFGISPRHYRIRLIAR
jgi:AraC-like DNA-binding protein